MHHDRNLADDGESSSYLDDGPCDVNEIVPCSMPFCYAFDGEGG